MWIPSRLSESVTRVERVWIRANDRVHRSIRSERLLVEGPRLFERGCGVMADGSHGLPTVTRPAPLFSEPAASKQRLEPERGVELC
jgi:hypothetical protein